MVYPSRPQQTVFYHEGIMKLARSLILKSDATAFLMNDTVNEFYMMNNINKSVDKTDPSTWRYYLHLQGIYHEYDLMTTGILKVKSLDTLQTIEFTRDNLLEHKATLSHYSNKGIYYYQLIEKYPDLHVLIDGICNPLDYETCLRAGDYRILSYDKSLVEPQEISLIEKLDEQIHQVVYANHSHNYSVFDDRYDALKLGMLATQIPGMIVAIREQFVHTGQAHSYHIWNYLASYFELDRYRQYLTFEQTMWLYRHIRYIDINAGTQDIFEALIKWLLTHRSIPLYGFDVENGLGGITVNRTKENLHGSRNEIDDSNLGIEDLLDKEKDLGARNTTFRGIALNDMDEGADRAHTNNRQTKLLESVINDYSSREVYPIGGIAVNYWCYLANTNRYTISGSLTNPVNGEMFTLDAKEGFILWLYLTSKLLNPSPPSPLDNLPIPSFVCHDILEETMDWMRVERNLVNGRFDLHETIMAYRDTYPRYRIIYSAEGFREFVTDVRNYRLFARYLWSTYGDKNMMADAEHVAAYAIKHPSIALTKNKLTFGQFLESRNWDFSKLTREQTVELAHRLYSYFTGGNLKSESGVEETQKAMLAILKQLSSYSIQFVSRVLGKNQRYIPLPHVGVGHEGSIERSIQEIFGTWLPKWMYARGQDLSTIYIDDVIKDEIGTVTTKEMDSIQLAIGMDVSLHGQSITLREIRLPSVGWRTTGHRTTAYRTTTPSEYYIYQNTLYRRSSFDEREKPFFQLKTGLPVDDMRE